MNLTLSLLHDCRHSNQARLKKKPKKPKAKLTRARHTPLAPVPPSRNIIIQTSARQARFRARRIQAANRCSMSARTYQAMLVLTLLGSSLSAYPSQPTHSYSNKSCSQGILNLKEELSYLSTVPVTVCSNSSLSLNNTLQNIFSSSSPLSATDIGNPGTAGIVYRLETINAAQVRANTTHLQKMSALCGQGTSDFSLSIDPDFSPIKRSTLSSLEIANLDNIIITNSKAETTTITAWGVSQLTTYNCTYTSNHSNPETNSTQQDHHCAHASSHYFSPGFDDVFIISDGVNSSVPISSSFCANIAGDRSGMLCQPTQTMQNGSLACRSSPRYPEVLECKTGSSVAAAVSSFLEDTTRYHDLRTVHHQATTPPNNPIPVLSISALSQGLDIISSSCRNLTKTLTVIAPPSETSSLFFNSGTAQAQLTSLVGNIQSRGGKVVVVASSSSSLSNIGVPSVTSPCLLTDILPSSTKPPSTTPTTTVTTPLNTTTLPLNTTTLPLNTTTTPLNTTTTPLNTTTTPLNTTTTPLNTTTTPLNTTTTPLNTTTPPLNTTTTPLNTTTTPLNTTTTPPLNTTSVNYRFGLLALLTLPLGIAAIVISCKKKSPSPRSNLLAIELSQLEANPIRSGNEPDAGSSDNDPASNVPNNTPDSQSLLVAESPTDLHRSNRAEKRKKRHQKYIPNAAAHMQKSLLTADAGDSTQVRLKKYWNYED